jgi:hypothetical protein
MDSICTAAKAQIAALKIHQPECSGKRYHMRCRIGVTPSWQLEKGRTDHSQ